ncbi:hypothetical protein J6590_015554 [Homalodisca vitripennis]|nr:hypothetical protein J6590_015554 [Homalodisca vitripennis]
MKSRKRTLEHRPTYTLSPLRRRCPVSSASGCCFICATTDILQQDVAIGCIFRAAIRLRVLVTFCRDPMGGMRTLQQSYSVVSWIYRSILPSQYLDIFGDVPLLVIHSVAHIVFSFLFYRAAYCYALKPQGLLRNPVVYSEADQATVSTVVQITENNLSDPPGEVHYPCPKVEYRSLGIAICSEVYSCSSHILHSGSSRRISAL